MKKIFKNFFSKNRIDIIKEYLLVKNPSILEIGVHKGDFSKKLIQNFNPKKIILVDPWISYNDDLYKNSWYGNSINSNQKIQDKYYLNLLDCFNEKINAKLVEVHRKTSDKFFLKNKEIFDLIYIDGNHIYEFVKNDIYNSLKFINDRGIIVLDDYALTGWWNDGVTKAVNFFQKKKLIKIIRKHSIFDYHHQCIVKKIKKNPQKFLSEGF